MKLPEGWVCEERGYYVCQDQLVSIVHETELGGGWYVYRWDGEECVNSPHYPTLSAALAAATRKEGSS